MTRIDVADIPVTCTWRRGRSRVSGAFFPLRPPRCSAICYISSQSWSLCLSIYDIRYELVQYSLLHSLCFTLNRMTLNARSGHTGHLYLVFLLFYLLLLLLLMISLLRNNVIYFHVELLFNFLDMTMELCETRAHLTYCVYIYIYIYTPLFLVVFILSRHTMVNLKMSSPGHHSTRGCVHVIESLLWLFNNERTLP